ncbi:hypothetical protein Tco_1193385 [Tanacetum coccineum]
MRELGINIEEINGCPTIKKRKRGKIQGYDPKGSRQWKEDPQKDVELFESNLKTRSIYKEVEIRGLLDSFSCGCKVLSGYAITDIITA